MVPMTLQPILLIPAALVFAISPPIYAQVGGGLDTFFTVDGIKEAGTLGRAMWPLGDLDGDSVGDLGIYGGNANSTGLFWVVSGDSGQSLMYRTGDHFGEWATSIGDVNGDGLSDFAATASGIGVEIVAGGSFQTIHSFLDLEAMEWPTGAGDLNGDGIPDLVTCGGSTSFGAPGSGLVRAYSGLDWSVLWNSAGGTNERLGVWGLAKLGDLNGDGVSDILASSSATSVGAVVAGYSRALSGVDGSVLLDIINPAAIGSATNFGYGTAGISDISGDGIPDILVAANGWDEGPSGENAGVVFCFSGADGSEVYRVHGGFYEEYFGRPVASVGDVDRDGWSDFIAGASAFSSSAGNGVGRVALYSGTTGAKIAEWQGEQPQEQLGTSAVSISDPYSLEPAAFAFGSPLFDQPPYTNGGRVVVVGHSPFIHASSNQVSVGSGGVIAFQLDFPDGAGGDKYKVLISVSGTGPTSLGWIQIPLTLDSWLIDSYWGNYPSQLGDMVGTLDNKGRAAPFLATYPGELSSSLVGRQFWLAAVARDGGSFWRLSSEAVMVTLVP